MRFTDKVVFVTGASSGIGKACGLRFQEEGASVFGVARREERLAESFEHYAVCDVRDDDQVRAAVDACVGAFEGIDFLINAAGVIGTGGVLDTPPEEWERIYSSNVDSVYFVTRHVAPHLIRNGGAIVNISSVTSLRPYGVLMPYCSSKAAVDMMTQCMALELAPHNVRVNAVNPGVVVTELHTASDAVADYDAFLEHSKETHPLGRVGQPEEIAALCAFLCSDEATWITGGIYSIDGGRQLMSAR
ncbi:MAG: SDR family oxidoreductase [Gemmatimonadetes bacterium]|uniref:SDR family oxidoreductase n=1 Tax=Candidatus Kutchimonas denitrificans TaxID=3056748 RepID=A0AAE5CAT7_9BACT|nr:SDR family oxidoreductase [Gemmatimonadota bacterium]NIR73698.1 SDR family oxidoreductase [Candidatus Kutchimonas denitrificans]NIS00748.1 SDR family oxidoreductase [Gemmatimonadota bacterium]NIT66335.1 SDR family oxidoreductase [Gemmatimonadota bacterium]NIU51553.1 glucose 1-dehydrogenase [Gemmatimonadota bacterium]